MADTTSPPTSPSEGQSQGMKSGTQLYLYECKEDDPTQQYDGDDDPNAIWPELKLPTDDD